MKKIIFALMVLLLTSHVVSADSTYYNYKKESVKGNSQINFSKIDMKNLTEVNLTFVGMEFCAQGFADFVELDKPVTLYASCSTDLRVRYKNRPKYEYDAKINKKDVHFKAKNYFYWNSYLQLLLLPDKKHATKLRCKFNGIENTLSSYIVENAASKEDSRTFKFIKRLTDKVESLDFALAKDLGEIPAKLSYCSDNLVACKYNIHFGSAKPLFKKRGNPNEVKDITITFYAVIHSIKCSDGNVTTYKTAPKPVAVAKVENKAKEKGKKETQKSKAKSNSKAKTGSKNKAVPQPRGVSAEKTKPESSSALSGKELAPRTDAELDDDLVAEVIFVTGAENSLKDESSIAPRTDSQLDDDLVGD